MNKPLLSVVIANYNYGRFLETAIKSVISQEMGERIELIVCDAASSDNSVEIIKKYANGLPANYQYYDWNGKKVRAGHPIITWWCSEKDGGQSSAFNKGFSHASGRFLTWLNADDVMMPGTLKALERQINKHEECEWFVGGVIWLSKEMRVIKCSRGRSFSRAKASHGEVGVWGPSSFFSRELFERAGGVDERFYYTMDSDLWYRFYHKCGAVYRPFIDYAWGLRLHEEAKMSAHNFEVSGQSSKDHPKWRQIEQERAWMYEAFMPRRKNGFCSRIEGAKLLPAIFSRVDTLRYKGKHYLEMFK